MLVMPAPRATLRVRSLRDLRPMRWAQVTSTEFSILPAGLGSDLDQMGRIPDIAGIDSHEGGEEGGEFAPKF